MIKVIFVCSGNICRSAMAEGYLEEKLKDLGIADKVYVSSAGINAKTGEESTPFANEAIGEYGVDIKGHKATHVKDSNLIEADYIIVMTKEHKRRILEKFKNELGAKNNIYLLKGFVKNEGYLDTDDPWGLSLSVYKKCAEEIVESIDELIVKLQKEI